MIADRLGVSKPAIYHHFRSRDDIVATLMQPVLTDAEAAAARLGDLPAVDRPAAARAFYAEFVVRHREVIALVFFDRAALPDDLPATVDRLVDAVAAHLTAGADPDAGTVLVYGVAALVTRRQHLDDQTLRAAVTAALAD
jgi:AcrR family transcriptional regulator